MASDRGFTYNQKFHDRIRTPNKNDKWRGKGFTLKMLVVLFWSLFNCHHTRSILESCPKHPICILEHTIFQTHHDKLAPFKLGLDQPSNILGVAQV